MDIKSREPGVFCISMTPFTERGELDETALRRHLRRMAAGGVGVYLAGSAMGEAFSLTPAETRRVCEIGAEELKGKVPVRGMGVEPRNARSVIEFARIVAETGLDAVQVYSLDRGHGPKPTTREIEQHFHDVLSEVRMPVVLSSHSGLGYLIPLDIIKRLLDDYPQIIQINTASDIGYLMQLLDLVGSRVAVYAAGPANGLMNLVLGGQGFNCADANVAPKLCASVARYYKAGDMAKAHAAFARVLRISMVVGGFGRPTGYKAALNILGLPGGHLRKPHIPLEEKDMATLRKALETMDIKNIEGIP